MSRFNYLLFPLFLILFIGCSHNQHTKHQHSVYADQEDREIKALTTQEVEGYLNGMGMGLSKVAELNQYPGPKHVLELKDQLELSDQQREKTEAFINKMKEEAVDMGKTYIAKERELSRLFESGDVSSSTVDSLLIAIGKIKGTLRAIHVNAHIEMKGILTSEQIKRYDELRGYEEGYSAAQTQTDREGQSQRLKQKMDSVYTAILKKYEDEPEFITSLERAQEAWFNFRDAHLESLYPGKNKQVKYGSVYSFCASNILNRFHKQRTEQLRIWLAGFEEGDVCSGSVKLPSQL